MRDAPLPGEPTSIDISTFQAFAAECRAQFCAVEIRKKGFFPMQGTVKFYNAAKGYGFITPDDGGKDIFVHISAVEQSGMTTLEEGKAISFEVEPDRKGKGPKAIELQVL